MHPDTITVALGERAYPLHFSANPVPAVRKQVEGLQIEGRKLAVLTNRTLADCQSAALSGMFGDSGPGGAGPAVPRYLVEPGEASKSLPVLGGVLDFLAAERLDRTGSLFVFGGGVVGDLGGFAAACYLRGIDYYQVPTTLLAMVDSSVGGKTGLNLAAGKNLVGAFHQPRGVFIGTDFLKTLPTREFAAGMAEVIKTALLGDAILWARLESAAVEPEATSTGFSAAASGPGGPLGPDSPDLAAVIRRCCELKAAIVQADEHELNPNGGRALLNLGHTFGHAIEQVAGYGTYLHGEAVAIGLAAAGRLSERLGLLVGADAIGAGPVRRIERVLRAHHLPIRLRTALPLTDLMAAMARDKKVRSGTLRFIVLRALGEAAVEPRVDAGVVESIWRELGAV